MPEKKSKGEELKEKLFMKQPDAYEKLSEKEIEKAYKYCDGYKKFLGECKPKENPWILR